MMTNSQLLGGAGGGGPDPPAERMRDCENMITKELSTSSHACSLGWAADVKLHCYYDHTASNDTPNDINHFE